MERKRKAKRVPISTWLDNAQPGDTYIMSGIKDADIKSRAVRAGRKVATERGIAIFGTPANHRTEAVTRITLVDE